MNVGVSVCLWARLLMCVSDAQFHFSCRCAIDTPILACLRMQRFRVSKKKFGLFGNRFFDARWCLMACIFHLFIVAFDYCCDVRGFCFMFDFELVFGFCFLWFRWFRSRFRIFVLLFSWVRLSLLIDFYGRQVWFRVRLEERSEERNGHEEEEEEEVN